MRESRYRQNTWVYRYFTNFSLHQLNNLSIIFILVFTILFSLLLIHDEYQEFEKMREIQQRDSFERQQHSIVLAARQFERFYDYMLEHHRKEDLEEVGQMASIIGEGGRQFILLFDARMQPLISGAEIVDVQTQDFEQHHSIKGSVRNGGSVEPALLYLKRLTNGYHLISGIYTKPYEMVFNEQYDQMKKRLIRIIIEIVTLSFILFGFILGISQIVNTMLENDVENFLKFFETVAEKYQVLNYTSLFFREFKKMAGHANDMVDTINEQKGSLQQLNLTLEDKVKVKTAKLQEKNSALETEKQFSHDLLSAQKQFIRYAIHETNTPLSVIVANIELYTMQHGKDRYLSKIEAAVKNIFNIYDDLSYLVKKDQVDYPVQRIDLCSYVQSRVEFFDEVATYTGVSFRFRCDTAQTWIDINETKLQRIIDNNLTNAIKYTRTGEVIDVDIAADADGCRFSVTSRSALIENVEKVFEAYYRERKQNDGFGLGLNLVKSICDEEGIAIMIESTEQRTRFTYRFKAVPS